MALTLDEVVNKTCVIPLNTSDLEPPYSNKYTMTRGTLVKQMNMPTITMVILVILLSSNDFLLLNASISRLTTWRLNFCI